MLTISVLSLSFDMKIGELEVSEAGEVNAEWLTQQVGRSVKSAVITNFDEKLGGLSGEFNVVEVLFADGQSCSLILKRTTPHKIAEAAALGTPREALFLKDFGPRVAGVVPRTYYGYGNMETGEKVVLMEKFNDAVPAGIFFGASNPNNWGIKDKIGELMEGNPSAVEVSKIAFRLYAELHAAFWEEESVLRCTWLRASDWLQGEGRESWLRAQQMAADAWQEQKAASSEGTSKITWDEHTAACIDASMAKIAWEGYQEQLKCLPWTVVHGDCHPHNTMWINQRSPQASLRLIDFEMVGVGSPVQELGQFLISHMEPAARRAHERELITCYYDHLVKQLQLHGVSQEVVHDFTFEKCWKEYVQGGAGRWLWFVPYLAKVCPASMAQFFHDQLCAFLHDHLPSPSDAPMPRV